MKNPSLHSPILPQKLNRGRFMRPYRLLVVDENPYFRKILLEFLRDDCPNDVMVVGTATAFEQIPINLEKLQPDFVLLDFGMPGLRGLPWTAELRTQLPKVGIVMLSVLDKPDYRRLASEAGADGFLRKDEVFFSLLPTLKRIATLSDPMT